jgi:NADH-quinone oxidoreductase subunit A
MLFLSYVLVRKDSSSEKLSSYECGFNPYEDSRMRFEIRYFLIGLLFIVFDLEIAFLLPYVVLVVSINLSFYGFFLILTFYFVFLFTFLFEWNEGALS